MKACSPELSNLEQVNDEFERLLFQYTTGEDVTLADVDRAFKRVRTEMKAVRKMALTLTLRGDK